MTEFYDLREEDFPFTIECYGEHTGRCLWREVVTGPGGIIVPRLAHMYGEPVLTRVICSSGRAGITDSRGVNW